MSELYIKHLNTLTQIEPDPEFRARTRSLIIGTPRITENQERVSLTRLFAIPRFSFSVAVFFVAFVFVGVFGFIGGQAPVAVSALDSSNISKELQTLSIDVKLAQVSYNQRIEETVAMAVSEISTRSVQQTAPLLSTESNAVPSELLERNQKIDALLQDVIF